MNRRREALHLFAAGMALAAALSVGCVHKPAQVKPLRGPIGHGFPSTTFPSGDGDAVEVRP